MTELPLDATDEQILNLVHQWVDLLAQERYDDAYALTAHDSYYEWTPGLMEAVITGYGLPEPASNGQIYRVTPEGTAAGGPIPRHEVDRYDGGLIAQTGEYRVGNVWFDLPLNGEWSDLTATFALNVRNDRLVLVLKDIHVF